MPSPTKPRVQGLMSGAAAGDQCDLARLEGFAANEFGSSPRDDEVSMGSGEPVQAFVKQSVRRIQKLFHVSSLTS